MDLHESTCRFIVPFYARAQKYLRITASLLKQGVLDRDRALVGVRTELYGLHSQILKPGTKEHAFAYVFALYEFVFYTFRSIRVRVLLSLIEATGTIGGTISAIQLPNSDFKTESYSVIE